MNRILHDGYVNIGVDEQDEVYHNYVLKHEIEVDNLAELPSINKIDEKLFGLQEYSPFDIKERRDFSQFNDYTARKQVR